MLEILHFVQDDKRTSFARGSLGICYYRMVPRAAGVRCSRENPALIVGKGKGGGELDQGSDDDKPGGNNEQHDQGVDDEAAPGKALEARPEPFESPGKLLGEQDDDQQKTGIEENGPDNVTPEAPYGGGAFALHPR
jgi:hypothetical protein